MHRGAVALVYTFFFALRWLHLNDAFALETGLVFWMQDRVCFEQMVTFYVWWFFFEFAFCPCPPAYPPNPYLIIFSIRLAFTPPPPSLFCLLSGQACGPKQNYTGQFHYRRVQRLWPPVGTRFSRSSGLNAHLDLCLFLARALSLN